MYIVDFFKRMGRKSNIPVLIYLILNILFISLITISMVASMGMNGALSIILGLALGIGIYVVSLSIALSPIGEGILRLQTGCKKVKNKKYQEYIYPIFYEVYQRARELDPSIPEDVQLFMTNDKCVNAFATGRKTVCVTKGMMEKTADQIKAALAHEFGHLAHKDTDLILLISIGNLFVTAIVTMVKLMLLMVQIMLFIFSRSEEGLVGIFITFLSMISIDLMMWIWTKIGTLLVMKSSRNNEYEADEFAFRLGYGIALLDLFDTFGHSGAKGLFATLESSHPDTEDRIARIEDLMDLAGRGELPAYNVSGQATKIAEQDPSIYMNVAAKNNAEYQNGYPHQQITGTAASGYSYQPMPAFSEPQVNRQMPYEEPVNRQMPYEEPVNRQAAFEEPVRMRPISNPQVCVSCGNPLDENAKFCGMCGTRVAEKPKRVFCINCGEPELDSEAAFCVYCGEK
ncbi:MAG: M48 family metalloprotease, partial [Lachnospiraceae bacterium]|nr:M48 family metalloprotease [Lachnospiraceae bacterium]